MTEIPKNPRKYVTHAESWLQNYISSTRIVTVVYSIVLTIVAGLMWLFLAMSWLMEAFRHQMFFMYIAAAIFTLIVAYPDSGVARHFRAYGHPYKLPTKPDALPRLSTEDRMIAEGAIHRNPAMLVFYVLFTPVMIFGTIWTSFREWWSMGRIDIEPAAEVLSAIVARDGAWQVIELVTTFGEPTVEDAFEALQHVKPVVWLPDPNRVSLGPGTIEEIRSR